MAFRLATWQLQCSTWNLPSVTRPFPSHVW